MSFFIRSILVCKLKLSNQGSSKISFVPEIASLQGIVSTFDQSKLSSELQVHFEKIAAFSKQYGPGVLPYNLRISKEFLEVLYSELLKNNIPLPPNVLELDLRYSILNFKEFQKNVLVHDLKIKIQKQQLTFFARNLPYLGSIITFILTIGLTVSTLITILGWGWSLMLLSIFGVSKLLANYADISGGPERRLLRLGLWIDRFISANYYYSGKFAWPRIALTAAVMTLLFCSSLITWYSAWQMIRCMKGIGYFPEMMAVTLAGAFAWASAGASFGRIYQDLYQLLFNHFSPYISFDPFNEKEKIDLAVLNHCFNNVQNAVVETQDKTLVYQYENKRSQMKACEKKENVVSAPAKRFIFS